MVKIIDGDLFSSGAKFIVHQVNCQGVMGSGVAAQVKKKYPIVFEEYKKICSSSMLGNIQIIKVAGKHIVNAFAQDKYGYDGKMYTSMKALRSCFEKIRNCTKENDVIAMPYKIACCRGGADWKQVYQMICDVFKDRNVELWRLDQG